VQLNIEIEEREEKREEIKLVLNKQRREKGKIN
jgi:hypothetical protein